MLGMDFDYSLLGKKRLFDPTCNSRVSFQVSPRSHAPWLPQLTRYKGVSNFTILLRKTQITYDRKDMISDEAMQEFSSSLRENFLSSSVVHWDFLVAHPSSEICPQQLTFHSVTNSLVLLLIQTWLSLGSSSVSLSERSWPRSWFIWSGSTRWGRGCQDGSWSYWCSKSLPRVQQWQGSLNLNPEFQSPYQCSCR